MTITCSIYTSLGNVMLLIQFPYTRILSSVPVSTTLELVEAQSYENILLVYEVPEAEIVRHYLY